MSRSGYSEDPDNDWSLIRWRGQVASAIRGKRGQAFLKELGEALDGLPEKRLIAHDLQTDCGVCAIGSVGVARGTDMSVLDPENPEGIAGAFGIAHQLVREIEWINDEWSATPEERWQTVRQWVASNLKPSTPSIGPGAQGSDPQAAGAGGR